MKVLLLCNHTEGNDGWSRYAVNLRDALSARGISVNTLALGNPLSYLTRPWKAFFLAGKLRKMDFDVLHSTAEPFALALLFLPENIRKRTVLTVHGNYGIRPFRWWMTKWLFPIAFGRIARFITVSNYTKTAVIKELERLGKKKLAAYFSEHSTAITNGIPLPAWHKKEQHAGSKSILHVGGVKPAKGLAEAIEACACYRDEYGTPFHFDIIGSKKENHYIQELRRLIEKTHMHDFVTFRGRLSDTELRNAYKNADLLLVPSYTTETSFEGFGLVYLEANAYGVPVIGPDTSGAAEAIQNGISGYTVHVYEPRNIAAHIHNILDEGDIDPTACRKWAEKNSIEKLAEKVQNVYSLLYPAS